MDKLEQVVQVKNKLGLHIRPASYIVKLLTNASCQVTLTYKGQSTNGRSVMGLMILAAPQNALIKVSIEGVDAKETMDKLLKAFETEFGENVE